MLNFQNQILKNYIKNLIQKGLYINNIDIILEDKNNRKIKAINEIKKNEILVKVPYNLIISLEKMFSSELNIYIKDYINDLKKNLKTFNQTLLSIFILYEMNKNKESNWYNYFNFLPYNYDNFPIFYPNNLLTKLKGTSFLSILENKKIEILNDYKIISEILNNKLFNFNFYEFNIAYCIVSSRIFGSFINNSKTDILVPFADMFNHSNINNNSTYYYENDNFIVKSKEKILNNCEINDFYGPKSNYILLLNYGFTLENNIYNELKLKIDDKCFYLIKNYYDNQSLLLYSYIRKKLYNGDINNETNKPISIKNEIKMHNKLIDIFKERLNKFNKKEIFEIKEDKISFNLNNCLIICKDEMDILNYYIKFSLDCLEFLNLEIEKAEIILNELIKNNLNNNNNSYNINQYPLYLKDLYQYIYC